MGIVASTVPSVPVSINTLILLAYKRAGLLPVEARISGPNMSAKLEHGRQTLDLIIDGLSTEGFIARTTAFYDLVIQKGQEQYTLPDTILDVHEDAMFTTGSFNPTSGELVCKQIDLATWQTLTVKTSSSTRPQLYVALRDGATVTLKFWPIPFTDGVMRIKTVRLFGGNADGNKNPDLHRYWYDYLVWQLAYYIAVDSSMPADKIGLLAVSAAEKKKLCLRYSFEHTPTVATLDYPTQWSEGSR